MPVSHIHSPDMIAIAGVKPSGLVGLIHHRGVMPNVARLLPGRPSFVTTANCVASGDQENRVTPFGISVIRRLPLPSGATAHTCAFGELSAAGGAALG